MTDTINIETRKNLELKKHVGAIHSGSNLTLIQRKIANALLYNSYNNLLTQDKHSIQIKALCDLIGYNSNDHKAIKKSLIVLISTVVQWNLIDKDKDKDEVAGVWNASAIISDASIDGSICTYSYSQNMRNLLHHPDLYGRLNMKVQAKFRSTYGLVLYENCIRYQNIAQTPWFGISTFRLLMGVERDKYPIFRDFKRRVVDKAISEVNTYTPIFIKVKFKKEGRAVMALQFSIERQQGVLISLEDNSNNIPETLSSRLSDVFGFSSIRINKAINTYGESYVLEKASLVENSASFQAGKIINLAKYLEQALKDDYQLPKSSLTRIYELQQQKEQEVKQQKITKEKLESYKRFQNKEILRIFHNEVRVNEKKSIEKFFEKELKDNIYYSLYTKEKLANPLVADRFCVFIRNHYAKIIYNIISFEEFCGLEKDFKSKQ